MTVMGIFSTLVRCLTFVDRCLLIESRIITHAEVTFVVLVGHV